MAVSNSFHQETSRNLKLIPPHTTTTTTMSDLLRITKVNSREPSDFYSYDESQRSFQYGEDADLYSIAEDSREGASRQSVGDHSSALGATPSPWDAGSAVEVRWRTEADEDGEPNVMIEDHSHAYEPHRDRRRCRAMTAACILCLVILTVVLSVTLTNRNKEVGERDAVMTGIGGNEVDESAIGTTARAVVLNALSERYQCTDPAILEDPDTPQGQIFEKLVKQVASSAVAVDDGYRFSPKYGAGMLAEYFAMMMLYESTGGKFWVKNEGWGTESDVCDWDGVVACGEDRGDGECGVTYLSIRLDGLYGQIPKELCCMPCLEQLYLDGNRLKGRPPECLNEMGLNSLELSFNQLDNGSASAANVFAEP